MSQLPAAGVEVHRLCTFDLDLSCGHTVTVSLNGWYPVSVACCERLGGAWAQGTFYPYPAAVDFVHCLSERYEIRPQGSAREPQVLLDRRNRTDHPAAPTASWSTGHCGRFPNRVGAARPATATANRRNATHD